MKDQFRFRNFQVYQDAKKAYQSIINLTKSFSRDYFELSDQLRRAALSVCLNIAEGSAKQSDKDFRRYILNALGSTNEIIAGLDIAETINITNQNSIVDLIEKYSNIGKQLGGLCKKLQS